MKNKTSLVMSCALSLLMMAATSGLAAKKAKMPEGGPDKETRKEMAKAHENMAKCLNSDRPFSECRKEMMSSCPSSMMKDGHCEMMGGRWDKKRSEESAAPEAESAG